MRFEELDTKMRVFETAHDYCITPQVYIVVRLDGRGFTKKTKELWQLEAPFDVRFNEAMANTTKHLMNCGFNIIYGYTQSDEISLLFHPNEDTFNRKTRKIISVLAGEASGFFSLAMGELASFDARICELPTRQLVTDYFSWRQEDAHRNSLNAHCYWLQRHQGVDKATATAFLSGKALADKHELLFSNGINFNDLPSWQKRGVGLYWADVEKVGFNPLTNTPTQTTRREITIDKELPLAEQYDAMIQKILDGGLN
ncbi:MULTISPECIES: tRNA(His) guanylyltransferase Thg1 family protein [unclassified Moraxella]|uniref:tRNA(His) guanylyltransferase Thg1 family protein n=1 Tax=unclassified Moraxella TaxID=2685852 RepID=UPI003AF99FC4